MMYHFMLGLRGCSAACAPSVGGCADDCACSIASFLISCAINVPAASHRPAPLRFLTDKLQQMAQPEFNHFIHHFEKSREHEHGNNDNRSRRLNFFATRVVDLLHLTADFLEKVFGAVRPCLQPLAKAVLICNRHSLDSLNLSTTHVIPASFVALPQNLWQGRRDSNPQVRFWRPAV